MADVRVPFGDNPDETATLLLAAAAQLGQPARVVKTSRGSFVVPEEVFNASDLAPKKPQKKTTTRKKSESADKE